MDESALENLGRNLFLQFSKQELCEGISNCTKKKIIFLNCNYQKDIFQFDWNRFKWVNGAYLFS